MKKYLLALSILLLPATIFAQELLDQKVSLSIKDLNIEEALYYLIDNQSVNFSFNNDLLPNKKISLRYKNTALKVVLKGLFKGTDIGFKAIGNQIVLFKIERAPPIKKFTISGFLTDAASGENLIAANIYDHQSGKGTVTNEYGFYSLTLVEGTAAIQISYLGYNSIFRTIELKSDVELNLDLNTSLTLAEVIVTDSDSTLEIRNTGMSSEEININDVKELPKLAGEADLIRTTHLLPGIQTGADGVGGIYVRGGNLGQNLILIDDVPVYNVSHTAGVFSIFNTDAVRSAKLVKGGFPARYGGRISSVLDVRTKEGNLKEVKASGNIGLLASSFSVEGPIQKDKSSFFVSGRGSFINWYLRPLSRYAKELRRQTGETNYKFYDFNAKLNFRFTDKDKVYISIYNGVDRFDNFGGSSDTIGLQNFSDTILIKFDRAFRETLEWGNSVASFRLNHLFSNKLFLNATITYSRLNVNLDYNTRDSVVRIEDDFIFERTLNAGTYNSSIEDFGGKLDFNLIPSASHYIRFGLGTTRHLFNPGALIFDEATQVGEIIANDAIQSSAFFFYVEDEMQIRDKFTFNAGLRGTSLNVGNTNYLFLEPRLSAHYQLSKKLSFKGSYGRMTQHLHLLTKSSIGLPTDLWVPSTDKIRPEESWQAVVGMDFKLGRKGTISVEAYDKQMKNLLTFTEGANVISNWEENVTQGDGRSYGLEFLWRQKLGTQFSAWLSYTLSKTTRTFNGINLGRTYNYKYDRTHDLKIAFTHRFRDWLSLSGNWLVSTGLAYSLPRYVYIDDNVPGRELPLAVPVIEDKNNERLPLYHRLDLSLNFYFKTKHLSHAINLGVYNAYSRKNPLYYNWVDRLAIKNDELVRDTRIVQVWLIPVLPSLSYSIKF